MALSGMAGPLIVYGQNPSQAGTAYQSDYNPDLGPSGFFGGIMLLDPRFGYRAPLQAGTLAAVGFYQSADYDAVDAVPSTIATANIGASLAAAAAALTLVTTTGAGITVSTAALTVPQSGVTLPAGTRFIDGAPAVLTYGQQGTVAAVDPRTMLARAVSITAAAGATATNATVRGFDFFGFAVTEVITIVAGGTATGKKGFKAVTSATLNAADAGHAYSVGTSDVYEYPLQVTQFSQVSITWAGTDIIANTGYLPADATTPATGITGSVRGTYATQSASNGANRLQISINPAPYNVFAANGPASLFGVLNFAG
jgi:hypothetical protein